MIGTVGRAAASSRRLWHRRCSPLEVTMPSNPVRTSRLRVCRTSGFTLIELMIVLVIMMALLVLTIPALRSLVNRGKLVGAAQQIEGVLRMARLEAIKRGVVTVVKVDYNQELV